MPVVKPVINDIDKLLGRVYGLNDEVVEYAKQYNSEYGRKQSKSKSLSDFTPVSSND
jgi:hypothetical protein